MVEYGIIHIFIINNMTLVITHYDKDYDWAKELSEKHNLNLCVYNKKDNNVGRESHTIFHFIVKNYNNLPNFIMFFQDGINGINENIKKNHPVLPFEYYINCKSKELIGHMRQIDQKDTWKGVGSRNDCIKNLFDFRKVIGINKVSKNYYSRCNNFSIGKEIVLLHPIEYYENILINTNLNKLKNPSEAYFTEISNVNIFLHKSKCIELLDDNLKTRKFKGRDEYDNNIMYGYRLI